MAPAYAPRTFVLKGSDSSWDAARVVVTIWLALQRRAQCGSRLSAAHIRLPNFLSMQRPTAIRMDGGAFSTSGS
eukprot:1159405-Pyramimonas_sp.AAC.1